MTALVTAGARRLGRAMALYLARRGHDVAIHYNSSAAEAEATAAEARALGVRAAVKDYVGKFDFQEATSFELRNRVSHNVAFTLGLTLGL